MVRPPTKRLHGSCMVIYPIENTQWVYGVAWRDEDPCVYAESGIHTRIP